MLHRMLTFVEFSQDAYYAKFNTIMGVRKHYFLLPEVTEEWPVKKIIDHSGKSRHHKRKRIREHLTEKLRIKSEAELQEIRYEQQSAYDTADEDGEYHIAEVWSRRNKVQQPLS